MMQFENFESVQLDDNYCIFRGCLPENLIPNAQHFETLWNLHPENYHKIKFYDKTVSTPRWLAG